MTAPFDICVLDDQVTSIGSNELDDFQWNMSEFDGSKGCVIERTVPHDAQFCTNRLKGRGEGK